MQTLNWYIRRLQSMSAAEIAWRVGSLGRDWVDRVRIPLGWIPAIERAQAGDSVADVPRGFQLDRSPDGYAAADAEGQWLNELLSKADAISAGRLTWFDHRDRSLGDPIDWHRDHRADLQTERHLIQRIDYRDYSRNGDCKEVWEPNRHHQFVVLARGFAASGRQEYADAVVEQMMSWIQTNPFGYGMNWRSPLELGVRVINWIFALELLRASGEPSGDRWYQIYNTIYRHCWEIARKLSRGSSANNHLVGEVAGLYVGASYFPNMPGADGWRQICRDVLSAEIEAQSYGDGCTREQALGYQFFVIQFYLLAGLAGRRTGHDFSDAYWSRLRQMIEFVARMAEFGPLPLFGDQDDGYVLDLGNEARDVSALMDLAGRVFSLSARATSLAKPSEAAYWLFGDAESGPGLETPEEDTPASIAMPECGYSLLQHDDGIHRLSALFDSAELGYGAIAAHGHADALSFSLRVDGEYVLVDPGTFDYFSYPKYRQYFRSTAAHNTVRIDDEDQSEMHGPFMWGRRAQARCTDFVDDNERIMVSGEHDGYRRLDDPVIHRRKLEILKQDYECCIEDRIIALEQHRVELFFHFGPDCRLVEQTDNRLIIDVAGRFNCELEVDETLELTVRRGSDEPISGWYSPGYHQKLPIITVQAGRVSDGECTLRSRIRMLWKQE